MNLHLSKLFFIFVLLIGYVAHSNEVTSFNEENEFIMKVQLEDGTELAEALSLYQSGTTWFIPLEEFAAALDISVKSYPALSKANGYILKESRIFLLDLRTCKVFLGNTSNDYDCSLVMPFQNDIYVNLNLIEKWFPVKIRIDPFGSTINIQALETLPIMERQERLLKQGLIPAAHSNIEYPRVLMPYSNFEGPYIDQQIGYSATKHGESTTEQGLYNTSASGEVVGMETKVSSYGDTDGHNQTFVTLAKRDQDGGLMGPLNAKKVELIDIQFPVLQLISEGKQGKGFEISNMPLYTPSSISTQRFTGTIAPGWEVELYQNGTLIARQIVDSNGQYDFKDILLIYGVNKFKFIFYGPQGQIREEHKIFDIRSSMLKPGESQYRMNYSNIANNDDRYMIEYRHGLTQNLSAQTAFARVKPTDEIESKNYGLLGLNSFFDNLYLGSTFASTDSNGWSGSLETKLQFDSVTLGVTRTELRDFISEQFKDENGVTMTNQTRVSLALNPFEKPPLRFTFEGVKNEYEDSGFDRHFLIQRTALSTGSIHWFNDLNWERGFERDFTGELTIMRIMSRGNVRAITKYNESDVEEVGLETQFKILPYSMSLGARRELLLDIDHFTAGVTRAFKTFDLNVNSEVASNGDFTINTFLTFSFQRDPHTKEWHNDPAAYSHTGGVSALVFVDKNDSGKFDEGDQPLPNALLKINQTNVKTQTNDQGKVFIPGLPAYYPAQVSVALSSIEDPFLRPITEGLQFYPRPGKTLKAEFPFVMTGEIDGTVQIAGKEKHRGIVLELVAADGTIAKKTTTESDGFFSMDGIKHGNYTLRVSEDSLTKLNGTSLPATLVINIPKEGLSEGNKDFQIKTKKLR